MSYGLRARQDDGLMERYRSQEAYALVVSTQNKKAVHVVAGQATGLEDCRQLLAMLGLDAQSSRPVA